MYGMELKIVETSNCKKKIKKQSKHNEFRCLRTSKTD